MPYSEDHIIAALRQARLDKGLSQRDLGKLVGVPQSHISRIEQGAVDLQLSSLLGLARALDLEVMPVPRKLVPAIESISRKAMPAGSADDSNRFLREIHRLRRLARRLSASSRNRGIERIQRVAEELSHFRGGESQGEKIEQIADMLEARPKSAKGSDLREAADELTRLRNALAHGAHEQPERPRPAYSLKSGDGDA
jgi:transcriptional regulator with XRE-family HTH domain